MPAGWGHGCCGARHRAPRSNVGQSLSMPSVRCGAGNGTGYSRSTAARRVADRRKGRSAGALATSRRSGCSCPYGVRLVVHHRRPSARPNGAAPVADARQSRRLMFAAIHHVQRRQRPGCWIHAESTLSSHRWRGHDPQLFTKFHRPFRRVRTARAGGGVGASEGAAKRSATEVANRQQGRRDLRRRRPSARPFRLPTSGNVTGTPSARHMPVGVEPRRPPCQYKLDFDGVTTSIARHAGGTDSHERVQDLRTAQRISAGLLGR